MFGEGSGRRLWNVEVLSACFPFNAGRSPNLHRWLIFTNFLRECRSDTVQNTVRSTPGRSLGADYAFEHAGVPVAIEDEYVIGKDFDIEMRPRDAETQQIVDQPTEATESEAVELENPAGPQLSRRPISPVRTQGEEEVVSWLQFLSKEGDADVSAPNPESMSPKYQRTAMLEYFSSFDAWTSGWTARMAALRLRPNCWTDPSSNCLETSKGHEETGQGRDLAGEEEVGGQHNYT